MLWVIFDGPPSHESGRFVELEDGHGHSVRAGEWSEDPRHEGWWKLGPLLAVGGLEDRIFAALMHADLGAAEAQRLAEGVAATLTASAVPTAEVLALVGEQREVLEEQLRVASATPGGISPDTDGDLRDRLEQLDRLDRLSSPVDPMRYVKAVFGS